MRIVSESGVAAGVRRIEAVTGRGAYEFLRTKERALAEVAERLKVNAISPDLIAKRLDVLLGEKKALEKKLEEALKGGGAQGGDLLAGVETVAGVQFLSKTLKAETMKDLQALGDVVRERLGSGVGVLVADFGDDKGGLVVVVTDDLRTKGITAGGVVKALAAKTGIRGGGKDHMAQAGLSGEQVGTMPGLAGEIVRGLLEGAK
jgi:alanyl-tRNA synthetase